MQGSLDTDLFFSRVPKQVKEMYIFVYLITLYCCGTPRRRMTLDENDYEYTYNWQK
jgi:hypothetical protein